jgi:hypothetical protein
VPEALAVELPLDAGHVQKRPEFRRAREPALGPCVIERLDPEAVARSEQQVPPPVVDHEREHPVQPRQELTAALVQPQYHLGVGVVGRKPHAVALQLGPQLGRIEDLAVEREHERAVVVGHRLRAAGQVDDREAPRDECHLTVSMHPRSVRPAMCQSARQPIQQLRLVR